MTITTTLSGTSPGRKSPDQLHIWPDVLLSAVKAVTELCQNGEGIRRVIHALEWVLSDWDSYSFASQFNAIANQTHEHRRYIANNALVHQRKTVTDDDATDDQLAHAIITIVCVHRFLELELPDDDQAILASLMNRLASATKMCVHGRRGPRKPKRVLLNSALLATMLSFPSWEISGELFVASVEWVFWCVDSPRARGHDEVCVMGGSTMFSVLAPPDRPDLRGGLVDALVQVGQTYSEYDKAALVRWTREVSDAVGDFDVALSLEDRVPLTTNSNPFSVGCVADLIDSFNDENAARALLHVSREQAEMHTQRYLSVLNPGKEESSITKFFDCRPVTAIPRGACEAAVEFWLRSQSTFDARKKPTNAQASVCAVVARVAATDPQAATEFTEKMTRGFYEATNAPTDNAAAVVAVRNIAFVHRLLGTKVQPDDQTLLLNLGCQLPSLALVDAMRVCFSVDGSVGHAQYRGREVFPGGPARNPQLRQSTRDAARAWETRFLYNGRYR